MAASERGLFRATGKVAEHIVKTLDGFERKTEAPREAHDFYLPEPPYQHRGAFIHFAQRLRERVDPALDPLAHWWRISVAVERGDRAVIEFCGRINRTGRRIWRYRLDDKRTTFVVFDHSSGVPITVLTPDREIRCGSRKQKHIIDGVTYVL